MSSSTDDAAQTGSMLHTLTLVDSMAPAGRQAVALALAVVPGALQSLLNVLKVSCACRLLNQRCDARQHQLQPRAFVDIPLTLLPCAAVAAVLTFTWALAGCHATSVKTALHVTDTACQAACHRAGATPAVSCTPCISP